MKKVLVNQYPNKVTTITENIAGKKRITKCKIGYLVDEILEEHGKHSSDSGTIKNKLSFCKAVIANIDDFNMLSDEAKQLTEKIYNFIEENNK